MCMDCCEGLILCLMTEGPSTSTSPNPSSDEEFARNTHFPSSNFLFLFIRIPRHPQSTQEGARGRQAVTCLVKRMARFEKSIRNMVSKKVDPRWPLQLLVLAT